MRDQTSTGFFDKYDFLLNNPDIATAMVWEDESGAQDYTQWPADKKTMLRDLLNGLEAGAPFPMGQPPVLTEDTYFGRDDAWLIYLTHVAHTLWLEANGLVSWRIVDYTVEQLRLLLDGRLLIKYAGSNQYCFDAYNGLGRVTDWNIRFSYDFMIAHDFIKIDPLATVCAFAFWCRTYVLHIAGSQSNPDGYETLYGYRGFPLVDRILDPLPETYGHISAGCWGTTGLFSAVMRSVNIPVAHGYSIFSTPGGGPGAHSRIELPTLNIGLCHSDDLYNTTCRTTGSVVPTERLFPALDWLEANISNPTDLDTGDSYTNNKYDQAMYNAGKHLRSLAAEYLTDYLLNQRAQDAQESDPPTALENALIGPSVGGGVVEFAKPYFSDTERQEIIHRIDDELKTLGNGSWEVGKQIVIARYTPPYHKDIWVPVEPLRQAYRPESIRLFQNYPNPFNPTTTIPYRLERADVVEVTIFNGLGQKIRTWSHGFQAAGNHFIIWDGKDDSGERVGSGHYIYQLKTVGFSLSRRMLFLK